jgi:hypothetical protein
MRAQGRIHGLPAKGRSGVAAQQSSTFGILANIMVRPMLLHRQLKKNQDKN